MTRRWVLRVGLGRAAAVTAAVATMLATGAAAASALPGAITPGQWPMAGQNINDTHFQAAEHAISPANVSRLAAKWTLTTAGAVSATPTVYDGAVYVPDYGGKLWAVAAGSGQVLWSSTAICPARARPSTAASSSWATGGSSIPPRPAPACSPSTATRASCCGQLRWTATRHPSSPVPRWSTAASPIWASPPRGRRAQPARSVGRSSR